MTSTYKQAKTTRRQLLASAVLTVPLWCAVPAQAQQTPGTSPPETQLPADNPPAAAPGGDVIVTGSRIRRPDLEGSSPVTTLGGDALARKGNITIQDAINELPQLGIGAGNRNQTFDSLNAGYATGGDFLNLRNLGTKRTLVVVNGRRFVGGDPGTSAVDLNNIPAIMVDRIDVVTGAASAVYGADAVTGVVNILLKDKFKGVMVTGHSGISSRGDAMEWSVAGIIGGSFDDNRGAAVLAVQHDRQEGFLGRDRAFGQFDANNFASDPIAGSTATPADLITNNGKTYTYDANNNLVLASTLTTAQARYQRIPYRSLGLAVKRTNIAGSAHYDLVQKGGSFSATLYTEAMYADSHNYLQYEDRVQQFQGSPYLFTPLDSAINNIRVPANNPYAQALVPVIGAIPAAGLSVVTRLSELGQNAAIIDRQTYRIVTGLRGDLPSNFTYDVYYQYGRLTDNQQDVNAFSRTRLAQTLNVNNNGTPSNFSDDFCADATARAQGCVPFNFFGNPTGINQAVKNYVGINSGVQSRASQSVASGFVSGNLFKLPGGNVAIVLGAEYRKETAEITPAQSYLDFSSSLRFQQGLPESSYDTKEVFGEISVPLIRDVPFFNRLEIGAAGRYSHYSTVGNQFSWNLRGEWEIAPPIRLRGVYSTAVRAPNLVELYSPSTAVISQLQDPCDTLAENGTSTAPTGTRAASCTSDLGAAAAAFNQTQAQSQTVVAITSGDATLRAETAKTYTFGTVLRPEGALKGLTATADYYHIKIDNVLSTLALQDTINQCYDQTPRPTQFCGLITRDPTSGQIIAVANRTFNAATETVAGLDTRVNYHTLLSRISGSLPGALDLTVGWSRLFQHNFIARTGAAVDHRKGQVGDFTNRFDWGVVYKAGPMSLSYSGRLYGAALADTTILSTSPLNAGNHIPAYAYHDLQATAEVGSRFTITLGVKNLFDTQPPLITTPARTVNGTVPTVAAIYDTRGRFFYSSAAIKF
jgi:iron complex outermembrane receptor protein